jgi:hypothetical protein
MSNITRSIENKRFIRTQHIEPLTDSDKLADLIPAAADFPNGYLCIETWNGIYWAYENQRDWVYHTTVPEDSPLYNAQVRAFNGKKELYRFIGSRGISTRELELSDGTEGEKFPYFKTALLLLEDDNPKTDENGFTTYRHKTGARTTLPVNSGKQARLKMLCLCANHSETGALYINDQMYLQFT